MDKNEITEAEAQYIKKMFGEPCYSKSQQSVRLINMLGKQPKLSPSNESKSFLVSDDMTMKQLIEKWYSIQFKNKQNKKTPEDYMLMYEKDKSQISLHDNENFMDLKSKLQCQIFIEDLTLMVFQQQFCPDQTDECFSESNHQQFEKKHKKSIQIPVKVMIDSHRAYYFYINQLSPDINFKQLNEQIQKQLKGNTHPIKLSKDPAYTLWIQKQDVSPLLLQRAKLLEQFQGQLQKNHKLTIGPKLFKNKVRQFCSPSQIITLRFTTPCFKYESPPAANDCLIRIACYKKNVKDKNEKQKADKIEKLIIEKTIIQRNYSEISKMKVSTLLKQENVEDPMVMSLYLDGEIFKPSVRFQTIEKIKKQMNKKQPINFVCIPDNFLYYQQVSELPNQNTMSDLLGEIPNSKNLPIKIYEGSRNQFTKVKVSRLNTLRQTKGLREEHKTPNFLDPIMVYTTDMICYKLNSFLRETSIALFDKKSIKDYWHYKASQKIIQNLLKLQNYVGKVFRASAQFSYDCQKGDILEWSGFTSTSKSINAAKKFIEQLTFDLYIFQIKTFSGKQIGKFSITPNQFEILLLPYTKFKVLDVQKNQKYTYVKMIQIPVPKKIPGNIVVWIDNNFKQNALYFNMFVRDFEQKNFDLIQLESNNHLITWLNQFKHIHDLPQVKVHFITNMNRSPKIAGKVPQGIETLNLIRSASATAKVIFFIEGIKQKWNQLKKAGKEKDPNISVIQDPALLMKQLLQNSLKN